MVSPKFRHWLFAAIFTLIGIVALALLWWFMSFFDHHEGTAAWVQAAGSLLIIWATAWIAGRNSREAEQREHQAREQLWKSIAVLACSCMDAFDEFLKAYNSLIPPSDPLGHFRRSYSAADFEISMEGLAAIPLDRIGDAGLTTAVLTLRAVMGRTKRRLDQIESGRVGVLAPDFLRSDRTPVFNAVASIIRIIYGPDGEQQVSALASRM